MSWVVWREQALLPALRSLGFSEVPIVEFTEDDLPGCDQTFMTMPRSPQVPLEKVYRAYPDRAVDLIERLGGFLQRVAATPLRELPRLARTEDNRHGQTWMGAVEALAKHPWSRGRGLDSLLNQSADVLQRLPSCFGIGGHGMGILYDGTHDFHRHRLG